MAEHQVNVYQSSGRIYVPIPNDFESSSFSLKRTINRWIETWQPSKQCCLSSIETVLPFLTWFKVYNIAWVPSDVLCGITIAIVYISQGMAYALLANLPAITGLYMSFFPALTYAIFGTSRHLSMGGIAVISLMTANVLNRFEQTYTNVDVSNNGTALSGSFDGVAIASTLGLTVGLVQMIMSIVQLGFVTAFLSDAFISSYTAATALLVFTSQIPEVFGIFIKRHDGAFSIVQVYLELIYRIKETNKITFSIAICAIISIFLIKECIEPLYKTWLKGFKTFGKLQIPIPIELVVIIIGTTISYRYDLNREYYVRTVKTIGKGFRPPMLPTVTLIPSLLKDALVFSLVSFTICFSLAKTIGKQLNYDVDANRELSAYGMCNIVSSFFGCYPCASSLARTSVCVNAGGKTQLVGVVSSVFLLIAILKIGSLLEPMPKACLAAIIIVSLKSLLMKIKEVSTFATVSKLEAIVWITTFVSTIVLDVDYGLIIGICASFFIVIFRQIRPSMSEIGYIDMNADNADVLKYSKDQIQTFAHTRIFRYESSISYFNGEHFHESIFKNLKPTKQDPLMESRITQHVIFDCATVNSLDYSGAKMLINTIKELESRALKVYICHMRIADWIILEKMGINKTCKCVVLPTIQQILQMIEKSTRIHFEPVEKENNPE